METSITENNNETDTETYIKSLNPKEYKAYLIAKNHLGTSFTLEKSVGYLRWKQNNNNNINPKVI